MSLMHDILVRLGWATSDRPDNRPIPPFNVRDSLDKLAEQRGIEHLNYSISIVDLLTLLGLPYNLDARKRLASELNLDITAEPGSEEYNIRLHQAVLDALVQQGGVVPPEWRQT